MPDFNPLDHFVQTRVQFIHQSYGDIMLVTILQSLWQGERTAIHCVEVKSDAHPMERFNLTITEHGRELLQCKQHWLKGSSHAKRHVGGVSINPSYENWYWSAEMHKPVFVQNR